MALRSGEDQIVSQHNAGVVLKFTVGKSTKGVKCSGAMLARRLLLVSGRIVKPF